MRLEQGGFTPRDGKISTIPDTGAYSPQAPNLDKFSIARSLEEYHRKINEIRFNLHEKEQDNNKKDPQTDKPKPNDFEPFVGLELNPNHLFVNAYNGIYAQDMQLNRRAVERTLQLAHLGKKVILKSMSPSRNRAIDGANLDGSVTQKRVLFKDEKIQEDKENPLSRAISTPQGWRIEINDNQLMEDVQKVKDLTAEQIKKLFIRKFSVLVKNEISKAILREKFITESIQHPDLMIRFVKTTQLIFTPLMIATDPSNNLTYELIAMTAMINSLSFLREFIAKKNGMTVESTKIIRKIDHFWEIFMPLVEVDKVIEAMTYMNSKGRTPVKINP